MEGSANASDKKMIAKDDLRRKPKMAKEEGGLLLHLSALKQKADEKSQLDDLEQNKFEWLLGYMRAIDDIEKAVKEAVSQILKLKRQDIEQILKEECTVYNLFPSDAILWFIEHKIKALLEGSQEEKCCYCDGLGYYKEKQNFCRICNGTGTRKKKKGSEGKKQ